MVLWLTAHHAPRKSPWGKCRENEPAASPVSSKTVSGQSGADQHGLLHLRDYPRATGALGPDVESLRVADPEKWIGEERRVWTKIPIGRLTKIPVG